MTLNTKWYWLNWARIFTMFLSSMGMCAVDWGKMMGIGGYIINIVLTYVVGTIYLALFVYGIIDYFMYMNYNKEAFATLNQSYVWLLNLTLFIGYHLLILAYVLYQVIHSLVHTPYVLISIGTTSILVCCVLNQFIRESKEGK
jgi:hypothetical protein